MKRLFLDDIRVPIDCASYMHRRGVDCRIYHEEWIIVRSCDEFIKHITENGLPDFISFDHDLADAHYVNSDLEIESWLMPEDQRIYEKTGMDCAKWLVEYCLNNNKELPEFAVHSANPAGTENINGLLKSFNKSR